MSKINSSPVWQFLKKKDRNYHTCNLCPATISIAGASTKGLLTHLRTKHPSMLPSNDAVSKKVKPVFQAAHLAKAGTDVSTSSTASGSSCNIAVQSHQIECRTENMTARNEFGVASSAAHPGSTVCFVDVDESDSEPCPQLLLSSVSHRSSSSSTVLSDMSAVQAQSSLQAPLTMRSTGQRGKALSSLYQAKKSVPPTSVEVERAFSASGSLMTKVRSRLSDSTLSKLCLLRYYFKNN